LLFENADESVNFIPMKKEDAKKFIQSRKDRYGDVDRQIVAHYIYNIVDYTEDDKFTSDGSPMTIKFTAKLKSVDFMDKNRKHILRTVNFNTSSENNETNSSK